MADSRQQAIVTAVYPSNQGISKLPGCEMSPVRARGWAERCQGCSLPSSPRGPNGRASDPTVAEVHARFGKTGEDLLFLSACKTPRDMDKEPPRV